MFFKVNKSPLTVGIKWCDGFLVTFPVSERYNGGIVIKNEWYDGYEVVRPTVPEGYELIGISCGNQLNVYPPYATAYLKPIDNKKRTKSQVQTDIIKAEKGN